MVKKSKKYEYPIDSEGNRWGMEYLVPFIEESNAIEGIYRDPTQEEVMEMARFMVLPALSIYEVQQFVKVYQPDAKLRSEYGMNVRVGNHYPPFGGPEIPVKLKALLEQGLDPWKLHLEYEKLHPFMDGNGRSGRAIWAWGMKKIDKLLFLHKFYYQTLQNTR